MKNQIEEVEITGYPFVSHVNQEARPVRTFDLKRKCISGKNRQNN